MSIDGIWTGEMYGPYGWENSGVYVLENGRIMGGNNRHYSTGTFRVSGDTYQAKVSVRYYGPPRSIFGDSEEQFEIEVTGTVSDGVVNAHVDRPDRSGFKVEYRMTKRMDLPASSG